jgi:ERCC4-type nuclease
MIEKPQRIIVDEREKASEVPAFLKNFGLQVEYRMLDIADYVVSQECAVERKQERDFLKSLYSGRLFDQAHRLSEIYSRPVLVVEGNLPLTIKGTENPRALWGALTAMMFMYGITVFFTPDEEQTAQIIYSLAKQKTFTKPLKGPFVQRKPKTEEIERTQIYLVASLPGIGPKLARRVLRHFQTVRRVFGASAAELSTVEGIGRVKAEQIVKTLDALYQSEAHRGKQTILGET